jgi:hypothetical protein
VATVLPSRENGHLAVAAVRVLRHRQVGPPSAAQIAELLGWTGEETHVVLRGLVDADILYERPTPFETHYELANYFGLEELKPEAEKEVLDQEVQDFKRRAKSRQEQVESLFRSGEREKQKKSKQESLEQQFAEFRKKKPRPLA